MQKTATYVFLIKAALKKICTQRLVMFERFPLTPITTAFLTIFSRSSIVVSLLVLAIPIFITSIHIAHFMFNLTLVIFYFYPREVIRVSRF